MLEHYINCCARHPIVRDCSVFDFFVRSTESGESVYLHSHINVIKAVETFET